MKKPVTRINYVKDVIAWCTKNCCSCNSSNVVTKIVFKSVTIWIAGANATTGLRNKIRNKIYGKYIFSRLNVMLVLKKVIVNLLLLVPTNVFLNLLYWISNWKLTNNSLFVYQRQKKTHPFDWNATTCNHKPRVDNWRLLTPWLIPQIKFLQISVIYAGTDFAFANYTWH